MKELAKEPRSLSSQSREDPCVSSKRRVSSSTLILGAAISADALYGDAMNQDLPHLRHVC